MSKILNTWDCMLWHCERNLDSHIFNVSCSILQNRFLKKLLVLWHLPWGAGKIVSVILVNEWLPPLLLEERWCCLRFSTGLCSPPRPQDLQAKELDSSLSLFLYFGGVVIATVGFWACLCLLSHILLVNGCYLWQQHLTDFKVEI